MIFLNVSPLKLMFPKLLLLWKEADIFHWSNLSWNLFKILTIKNLMKLLMNYIWNLKTMTLLKLLFLNTPLSTLLLWQDNVKITNWLNSEELLLSFIEELNNSNSLSKFLWKIKNIEIVLKQLKKVEKATWLKIY